MGRRPLELAGKQFGRLTAINPTGEIRHNCYMWHCRCSCGNECDVESSLLSTGVTQSCGCIQADNGKKLGKAWAGRKRSGSTGNRKIDISGQRFGRLTVLSEAEERKNGCVQWRCKCDCGKECIVLGYLLRNGETQSCGCYNTDRTKESNTGRSVIKNDITGQKFGHLTAMFHERGDYWLWKCDCGNTCRLRASSVYKGVTKSCGHALPGRQKERVTVDNVFEYYNGTSISQLRSIMNGKVRSNNTSGYTGIRIRNTPKGVRYQARIQLKGKMESLGTFDTLEEAIKARKKAEERVFGEIITEYEEQ